MSRLTILEAYSQVQLKNCASNGLRHLGIKYVHRSWYAYCHSKHESSLPEPCSRCVHYGSNTVDLVKELE